MIIAFWAYHLVAIADLVAYSRKENYNKRNYIVQFDNVNHQRGTRFVNAQLLEGAAITFSSQICFVWLNAIKYLIFAPKPSDVVTCNRLDGSIVVQIVQIPVLPIPVLSE